MPVAEHTVWVLLFEQTPPVLRWILGLLTIGLFTLMQYLYKNHKDRVNRLEKLMIDSNLANSKSINGIHAKIDNLTLQLLRNKGA